MPVSTPSSTPRPTASSPQLTRAEKSPACGRTKVWRKLAYHPCTDGLDPDDLEMAPLMKPVNAFPLVPQAGSCIFSQPAVNQSAPTSMRRTNHSTADPAEPKKNRVIEGSGNCSCGVEATRAGRSAK